MDTKVKKSVKESVIEWIQTLDDEELIYELYYFKERHRKITQEEKQEYNRWLSELDYEPQLDMLSSIIASSPERDTIWNELSPEAGENLRTDEEFETTDIKHTSEQFWELVSNLKKGDELSREGLSEAEQKAIKQGLADVEAGRTTPHEEVMKDVKQWLNDMKLKQMKENIPELPEDMRAEIADFIMETLNRSK